MKHNDLFAKKDLLLAIIKYLYRYYSVDNENQYI